MEFEPLIGGALTAGVGIGIYFLTGARTAKAKVEEKIEEVARLAREGGLELAVFKLEVARERASNSYVAEVERRLTEAVGGVHRQIERLDAKMDRLLEIHGDKK